MISRYFGLAAALAAALAISGPVWAHHSHSNYDQTQFHTMRGTITELSWVTPHVWIYLEVEEAGESRVWVLEGGGIPALERRGWSRDSMKVGDTISVRCHQLRDGSNGCLLGFITTADGVEKEFD